MTNAIPEQHDLDWLHSTEASGAKLKYLHFWGHSEPPQSAVGKACLSQWYPAPFTIDGNRFSTAEHYMMFRKAQLFADNETAERILCAASPAAVKALGRKVRGFQDALWEQHRVSIVVAGNHAKFSQSPALREFLVGTQRRVLVEASPVDRIWGIGLSVDDPRASHPAQWRGLNLLGFALMDVRAQL
ncbi:MAG TPA: NADAR family protein [Polyangiaceae bacterium]|nr:NADAR family protein [Polyangiaceae bacterium]